MERLTNKDWHKTKFMGLNEREVLHRLWELENLAEKTDKKMEKFVEDFIEYLLQAEHDADDTEQGNGYAIAMSEAFQIFGRMIEGSFKIKVFSDEEI